MKSTKPAKPSFRPRVETLEERAVPAATPFVTPHNGIIIPSVQVSTVYYGDAWNDATGPNYAELQAKKNDFNQYFATLTNSPFMDSLAQYSGHPASLDPLYSYLAANFPQLEAFLPEVSPTHGQFIGTEAVAGPLSQDVTVQNSDLTNMLAQQFANHSLAQPTDNTLYVVFTPPNISLSGGIAFHNSFVYNNQNVFYAAISYVGSQAWRPNNMTQFQAMTTIASHELVEAITDPILNEGYVDDTPPPAWSGPQEISDLGNGSLSQVPGFANYSQFGLANGYIIQQYWSNKDGKAVGGAQINTTNPALLDKTIPAMPTLAGAAFTLHSQHASIDMQFTKQVAVDSTHANIGVIWGQRTDTHALVAINGDRLDVTIVGADNQIVFSGYMETPGGDWKHRKELSGTIYGQVGSTNLENAEPAFGLQADFHIYIPGDFNRGGVSAEPFSIGGDHFFVPGDYNPGPTSAGPFGLREVFDVLPPSLLADLYFDLRHPGDSAQHVPVFTRVTPGTADPLFTDLLTAFDAMNTTPTQISPGTVAG
jgi:hypothetical protein